MTKPKKLRDSRMEAETDERVLPVVGDSGLPAIGAPYPVEAEPEHHIIPRRYMPPQCSLCTALRDNKNDYTRVVSTRREEGFVVRYCKCGFCGNTFKESERV